MPHLSKAGILLLLIVFISSCGTKRPRTKAQVVPITVNIRAENRYPLETVNFEIYRYKLMQELRQFQSVDLELVEADENPEVTLDLTIENFTIWPKDERTYRRVFTRTIAVGTDDKGKPIYQTVSAAVDFTYTTIKSNVRLESKLTFKGEKQDVFSRVFVPRYTFNHTSVGNITGDPRAVDASILSAGSLPNDPTADDFLLSLSHEEMIRRLSNEIRDRYR